MSFSVYPGGSVSGNNIYANSSVIDNSWGCTHYSYSTRVTITSPTGRVASQSQGGLQASTQLSVGADFGNYSIVTTGTYNCSCIFGGQAGFGGGQTVASAHPASLKLISSNPSGACNGYSRQRIYEVISQYGTTLSVAGIPVGESYSGYSSNGCNLTNPKTASTFTNNQGRFQDNYSLSGAPKCTPNPSCPSCGSTATQTIRVGGYDVGSFKVTWRCDDVTINP